MIYRKALDLNHVFIIHPLRKKIIIYIYKIYKIDPHLGPVTWTNAQLFELFYFFLGIIWWCCYRLLKEWRGWFMDRWIEKEIIFGHDYGEIMWWQKIEKLLFVFLLET